MILRPALHSDLETLVPFARAAFTDAFGHFYDPEDLAAFLDDYRAPERYAAAIDDPTKSVTLAEEDGRLLGYATVDLACGFDERPDPQPRQPATLGQLYCASDTTGRGVGAALLDQAIAEARERGCDVLQLSVYSENFGAQRFYQRYGFAHVADIDFWVGRHRDGEFLYELTL